MNRLFLYRSPALTVVAIIITEQGLLRLLQLSSVSLPVGGYAFSQGLESAIEQQWLNNAEEVSAWLEVQLLHAQARVDVPVLLRQLQALRADDHKSLSYWDHTALACRETEELLLTDSAMGEALLRLLRQLEVPIPTTIAEQATATGRISFVTTFALAAHHWGVSDDAACLGLMWSWLENQVAAATKLVPLGQSQAQRLLGELQGQVPEALRLAKLLPDDEIGGSLPALAIASAQHETQYSRLFRS